MKIKGRSITAHSQRIKLKTTLIVAGILSLFVSVIGWLYFVYLNVGITEDAKAAPTNISGVINSYLRVTSVNLGSRQFITNNLSGNGSDFAVGKTIMIHQAQGANITTTNSSAYGTITAYNNAGNYEFATISSVP